MSISKVNVSSTDHQIVGSPRYATCSTAAATAAKVAAIADGSSTFTLEKGARICVKFIYANTVATPTLNVGSTGAKAIYWHGAALTSSQYWQANAVIDFVYNGTQWELVGVASVTGVKGSAENGGFRTGNVLITSEHIGLGNVDNTSDFDKPLSFATQTALNGKQATITGAAASITNKNLTANRALISDASGKVYESSVTSTELGYLDGVTSAIQTQLDGKVPTSRTVNGKALSSNITLSANDVGAAKSSHNHDTRYYTESEMDTKLSGKSDTSHDHMGKTINPAGIELFPGTTAGHGGYIDFHYKNSNADFTSRIIEVPSGYVQLNGNGIMTRANIAAAYNVQAQFTNGIFEYSNSVIKVGTICFAQFRGGLVSSSFRDTALSTSSDAGKVKIVAKNGETFNTTVNVLMINL